MNELPTGVERSLAVLPQPAAFLQPGKAALDHPALWDHRKPVHLAALGNLHRCAQHVPERLCKRFTCIAAIGQHSFELAQARLAPIKCLQSALAVCHLGRGHRYCVRQALAVHGDVALDARDFLARIVVLVAGAVSVLHALRVHDQERGQRVACQCLTGPRQPDFFKACSSTLMPSGPGLLHLAKYE